MVRAVPPGLAAALAPAWLPGLAALLEAVCPLGGQGRAHLPQVAAQKSPFTIQLASHLPIVRCSLQVYCLSGGVSRQGGGEAGVGGGEGEELAPAGVASQIQGARSAEGAH